jgi:hypothetical protein
MANPMRLHTRSGLWVGGMLARPVNAERTAGQRVLRAIRYWWKRQQTSRIEDEVIDRAGSRLSVRVVLCLVLPVVGVLALLVWREPENQVAFISLVFATFAIVYAVAAEAFERRLTHPFWIQIASGAVYAAIITALLLTFVMVDHPRPHTHWIIFFLYFLLIRRHGAQR